MKSLSLLKIWIILISLTILSAIVALGDILAEYRVELIIALALTKFYIVSLYFMDLHKAHIFWKATIMIYMLIVGISLSLIL